MAINRTCPRCSLVSKFRRMKSHRAIDKILSSIGIKVYECTSCYSMFYLVGNKILKRIK